jgi:hypothetical protein
MWKSCGPVTFALARVTQTYLPASVETQLISKVNASAAFKALFPGQQLSDTATGSCVTTTATDLSSLPPLALSFPKIGGGSFTVTLPATPSYLAPASPGSTSYCLTVGNAGPNPAILGAQAFPSLVVVIDRAGQRLGLAPAGAGCQ